MIQIKGTHAIYSLYIVWVCACVVQARHVEGGNTGLIPSQMLEEKRKAFVKRDVELAPAGTRQQRKNKERMGMELLLFLCWYTLPPDGERW